MKVFVPIAFAGEGACGTEPITGRVIGPLIVHRNIRRDEFWNITHIRTGRHCGPNFCCQKSAIRLAKSLSKLNWNFSISADKYVGKIPSKVQPDMAKASQAIGAWPNPCEDCQKARRVGA